MTAADLPGAILGEGIDGTVPAHYGSPVREQRALLDGTALTDLSQLELVTVTGPDRITWVHSMTTQDIAGLQPGQSTELLLLDVNGRIQVPAGVYDDGETLYLLTDVGGADGLREFLHSMRFMLRVEVAVSTDFAFFGGYGEADLPRGVAFVWRDPWPEVGADTVAYGPTGADHPGTGHSRFVAAVPKEAAEAFLADWLKSGTMAGMLAWEAQRVADWRPRPALDVEEKSLPHEWDWLRTATHLNKGCYRGQEAIARTVNLGRPPRRAVFLYIDGSPEELPAPGTDIERDGKRIGVLTSVVRDMDAGPIGLGLIRRSTPVDAELEIGGILATAETIVSPDGRTERSYERPKLK